jgi:hypothetical protein
MVARALGKRREDLDDNLPRGFFDELYVALVSSVPMTAGSLSIGMAMSVLPFLNSIGFQPDRTTKTYEPLA